MNDMWRVSSGILGVAALISAQTIRAQVDVTLAVVNQEGLEIQGSRISVGGIYYSTGTTVSLAIGSHVFGVVPGVPGVTSSQLHRSEVRSVSLGTDTLRFSWITADVLVRLQDQHGTDIPNSRFTLLYPSWSPCGSVLRLPITDESIYPTMSGAWVDGYPVLLNVGVPGVGYGTGRNSQLARSEYSNEVAAGATELAFEWITSEVAARVHDQHGVDIPGSQFTFHYPAWFPAGIVLSLPITDETVYPSMEGAWSAGYNVQLNVGVPGVGVGTGRSSHLHRVEHECEVAISTTDLSFEWITSRVTVRLRDQRGADIPNSQFTLHYPAWFPAGSVLSLPITDEAEYPTLEGLWASGYNVQLNVGVPGAGYGTGRSSNLHRSEYNVEISAITTQLDFEWLVADVTIRVHDQHGLDIPNSRFTLTYPAFFGAGTILTLPITDESVYPTILGTWATGYPVLLNVGIPGGSYPANLWRSEVNNEVTAATTELGFEWRVVDCPLYTVDGNGLVVAGSSLLLPPGMPAYVPGQSLRLPITENAIYPTITGAWVNGYPITVTPGDIAPTSASFQFEVLANGSLEPGAFQIANQTYSLLCDPNRPPLVDAGLNVEVLSSQQVATSVEGRASDPDGDALTYVWLEGMTTLFGPASVGPGGEAALSLGSLPPFSSGPHVLTLVVSDCCGSVMDDMTLTVGNSPPDVSCSGEGIYQAGTDAVFLAATVADFDGDWVSYQWKEGARVLSSGFLETVAGGAPVGIPAVILITGSDGSADLGLGTHTLDLVVDDGVNVAVACSIRVEVVDTDAPRLALSASHGILWPPNHQMVDVTIQANAVDSSGGSVWLSATVTSSEDAAKHGSGSTIPDFSEPAIDQATGTIHVELRAERAGRGPGRRYTVTIMAVDAVGNTSIGTVHVLAPHDKGN